MKKNRCLPWLTTALILLFTACKKESKHDLPTTTTCTVSKVLYYDASGSTKPKDSAVYSYTGTNVNKVKLSNLYYTLEYNGNTITKRNIFIYGNTSPDYYDVINYNGDGTINKIERFKNAGSTFNLFYRYEFLYNAGKLSQVNYYNMANNVATKEAGYSLTYTGNNITTAIYTDYTGTSQTTLTINYTYDTNTNYLKKQNPNVLLVDYLFIDIDAKYFPMVYSANNVLKAAQGTLGYTLDANENLKDVMLQNNLYVHYNYLCE